MATKHHCAYCFDVIVDDFESKHGAKLSRSSEPVNPSSFGRQKYPMFVTWKKHTGDETDWRLRGCIGTFSARDLVEGLREYALISAFRDSRFSPLAQREIPFLSCDVSLLTDFETASHLDDWKLGKHGITIDFVASGKSYNATYLPEVASEQGWSRNQTINELILKAGFKREVTPRIRGSIKLTRYQSSKCSLTYNEYLSFRVRRLSQTKLHPHPLVPPPTLAWDISSTSSPRSSSSDTSLSPLTPLEIQKLEITETAPASNSTAVITASVAVRAVEETEVGDMEQKPRKSQRLC